MIFSDLEWIPDIEIGKSAMFLWTVFENVLEIDQIKISYQQFQVANEENAQKMKYQ